MLLMNCSSSAKVMGYTGLSEGYRGRSEASGGEDSFRSSDPLRLPRTHAHSRTHGRTHKPPLPPPTPFPPFPPLSPDTYEYARARVERAPHSLLSSGGVKARDKCARSRNDAAVMVSNVAIVREFAEKEEVKGSRKGRRERKKGE